ncbi:META domain-containing protein [Sphingorhabdus pulchriflava]|nr:META domain-containing protein [Sphingorhabdus pulchriflava]
MQVDKASRAACLKAASLNDAVTGPPIRYSDRLLIDARVVTGTWPQPHMKGAKAKMLCLYHRRSKRVEVQELAYPIPPAPQAMIKDVWWQAYSIDGKPVVSGSEVTLMLGSDGKVGGKSGCNGYGASYQLDGSSLKVFPPMIGTMMACAPNLMDQEQAYRALMEKATIASLTTDGKLEVVSASGATIRFTKK